MESEFLAQFYFFVLKGTVRLSRTVCEPLFYRKRELKWTEYELLHMIDSEKAKMPHRCDCNCQHKITYDLTL